MERKREWQGEEAIYNDSGCIKKAKTDDGETEVFESEDHISRLPDLCFLEVCKHLKKVDINNLMTVNKRVHLLSGDQSLERVKWEGGELVIYQMEKGYGFALDIIKRGHKLRYQFDIFTNEYGYITENIQFGEERNVVQPEYNEAPQDIPFPMKLFTVIKDLLRHHAVKKLYLAECPFEQWFFSELENLLGGQTVSLLYCYDMVGDVTNESQKSFARLLRNVKSVHMYDTPQCVVNEEFLNDISETKIREFGCVAYGDIIYDHRFRAKESLISRIIHITWLCAARMLVNAHQVADLVMMHMDTLSSLGNRSAGSWIFSVDQPTSSDILSSSIRRADYEYRHAGFSKYSFDYITHVIIGKRNGMTAEIIMRDEWERVVQVLFNYPDLKLD